MWGSGFSLSGLMEFRLVGPGALKESILSLPLALPPLPDWHALLLG